MLTRLDARAALGTTAALLSAALRTFQRGRPPPNVCTPSQAGGVQGRRPGRLESSAKV
jgi:hypothetical protein